MSRLRLQPVARARPLYLGRNRGYPDKCFLRTHTQQARPVISMMVEDAHRRVVSSITVAAGEVCPVKVRGSRDAASYRAGCRLPTFNCNAPVDAPIANPVSRPCRAALAGARTAARAAEALSGRAAPRPEESLTTSSAGFAPLI